MSTNSPAGLAGLAGRLEPSTSAVITMELQRGVCGDLATMPALAAAVEAGGVIPATAAVLGAARRRSVPVVHCTFSLRADREGTPLNAPLIRMLAKRPDHLLHGSPAAQLIAGLGIAPTDLQSHRHHGFSPFTATDLDPILRARDVRTLVVTGMSLNLGIPGTVVEAVNLGYTVFVVRDCVAGIPADYGEAMIANTLSMVASIVTSSDVIAAWDDRAAAAV